MGAGLYYLHTNGELIWKPLGEASDMRESDFVRHFWPLNLQDRESAWSLLIEASALGVDRARIDQLADLWQCDDIDAQVFAEHVGIKLYPDGSAWCASRSDATNLQESPHGFSEHSAIEAMANLAKQLGFRAQKMWGPTFRSLTSVARATA